MTFSQHKPSISQFSVVVPIKASSICATLGGADLGSHNGGPGRRKQHGGYNGKMRNDGWQWLVYVMGLYLVCVFWKRCEDYR